MEYKNIIYVFENKNNIYPLFARSYEVIILLII